MDLDAIIAAANRAQQACDYRLGNCSRILHIGFFFDGVGRNIEQDALANRLSNIGRLFRANPIQGNLSEANGVVYGGFAAVFTRSGAAT